MNHTYYPYTYSTFDTNLSTDLEKAINGEYSAIVCYEQLAQLAPTAAIREQIIEIRNDEIRHYQQFQRIYTYLTGQQFTPKLTEQCPNTYMEGIDYAFHDEQHTVDFYLEVARKTQHSFIKESFSQAAADEQQHAVWFLYFIQQK